MPDFKEPEDFGPEEEKNPDQEIKDLKLLRIAISYLSREIADDTPSEINGLTALDQLIIYEFGLEDDENFNETLEELKDDVIFEAQCLEEEDEEEVEMYIPDKEQAIRRIALYTLADLITDDVVSRWPEYTPLEQIIMYEWGYLEEEEIIKIKKKIREEEIILRGGSALKNKKDYDNYFPSDRF